MLLSFYYLASLLTTQGSIDNAILFLLIFSKVVEVVSVMLWRFSDRLTHGGLLCHERWIYPRIALWLGYGRHCGVEWVDIGS